MAYSTQRATSDGTLVLLNLAIEYFDRSEISVLIAGIVSAPGSGRWNWVGTTNSQIAFTPAIPNGVEVTIKRSTQLAAPLNQYTKGAQFIAETLDQNFNQVLRIAQEASEGAGAKDVYNDVDYHGFKLRNVGFATADNDAVTFGQYRQDAAGANAQRVLAENARVGAETARTLAEYAVTNANTQAVSAAGYASNAMGYRDTTYSYVQSAFTARDAAAASATAADGSKTAAAGSATAAATTLANFKNLYYGSLSAAPTTRPDASAMVVGDMYFDSTLQLMRVRQSSGWVSIAAATTGNSTQDFAVRTLTASVSAVVNGDVSMTSQNGGALAGFRNKIINGNMRINQRGQSTVQANNYFADRWLVASPGGTTYVVGSLYTDGGVSKFGPNHIGIVCQTVTPSLTAPDYGMLSYCVEGYDMADLKWGTAQAKTITISFRGIVSQTGTYCVAVRGASYSRTYVVPVVMVAGSVQQYSVTVPGDTAAAAWDTKNGVGIAVSWCFAAGTQLNSATANTWSNGIQIATPAQFNGLTALSNYLVITDVQLEVGTVATPFELRPMATELALCQRYYFKTFNQSEVPRNNVGNSVGAIFCGPAAVSAYHSVMLAYPVPMRVTPSLTFYSPTTATAGVWSGTNEVPAGVIAPSERGAAVSVNNGSPYTPGTTNQALYVHLTATAEF